MEKKWERKMDNQMDTTALLRVSGLGIYVHLDDGHGFPLGNILGTIRNYQRDPFVHALWSVSNLTSDSSSQKIRSIRLARRWQEKPQPETRVHFMSSFSSHTAQAASCSRWKSPKP